MKILIQMLLEIGIFLVSLAMVYVVASIHNGSNDE
jgi:hypothetical protein